MGVSSKMRYNSDSMHVGLMQGRLSSLPPDGALGCFHDFWKLELPKIKSKKIRYLEWIVDHRCKLENPILNDNEKVATIELCKDFGIEVQSAILNIFCKESFLCLTNFEEPENTMRPLLNVLKRFVGTQVRVVTLPILDLESAEFFLSIENRFCWEFLNRELSQLDLRLALELELEFRKIKKISENLESFEWIGFTFDMGNSVSVQNDSRLEIGCYGEKLFNVHIKDRTHQGDRVALGYGDVNFESVKKSLLRAKYDKLLILEGTWRGDNPEATIRDYIEFCEKYEWTP